MKLTLKRKFQGMADHVTFPVFFYIYETGKIIGANKEARGIIGEETKNINQIWKNHEKKKVSEKELMGGYVFLEKERIWVKDVSLVVDMEFIFYMLEREEHIVTVLVEESYKRAFSEENSRYIPRVIVKDKRLNIRSKNRICCLNEEEAERLLREDFSNDYVEEAYRKADILEKMLIDEQKELFGYLQQVKEGVGKIGFANVNRQSLINRNGNCIGLLIICEFTKEAEQEKEEKSRLQRERAVLEAGLLESKKVAFSIMEDREGTVDYLSSSIELFGYEPEDFYFRGLNWMDIVPHEDKKLLKRCHGEEEEREYHILTKAGEKVKVHEKVTGLSVYTESLLRQGILWQIEEKEEKHGNHS